MIDLGLSGETWVEIMAVILVIGIALVLSVSRH